MEAPPLERKLVAILAADIQGYSRLMSIAEEDTLATLSAHRAITDAIIAQHGGRICSTFSRVRLFRRTDEGGSSPERAFKLKARMLRRSAQ
jgi:class 3 adenylate cyclase